MDAVSGHSPPGSPSSSGETPMKNSAGGISGDDMTEDEVAMMVKNALRKARRAMNNSSPLNTPMSSSDEWSEPNFSTPERKHMNHKKTTKGPSRRVVDSPDDEDDELAKRIEAEINSARAFAEYAYFGKAEKGKEVKQEPMSPVGAASVKSDATEVHTNKTSSCKSPSSPLGYNTTSPRSRRKAARKLLSSSSQNASSPHRVNKSNLNTTTTPTRNDANNTQKLSTDSSPRQVHPNNTSDNKELDKPPINDADGNDDKTKRTERETEHIINENPKEQPSGPVHKPTSPRSPKKSPVQVLSNKSSNVPASNVSTHTQNIIKERSSGSRQVTFRHPYPLPPPPVAPRPDDIIIDENSVPEKTFSIKVVEPDAELEQLIQQTQDEHNIVRRSNACGAIKVLASHDTHKAKLARTDGLLDALVYASLDDAVDSDALDARTRAVTALLYLCEPKDNRIILAHHPGVLDVLMKVIEEDTGEARLRACSALATLAKTAQNRSAICSKENLAIVLSNLMVQNAKKQDDQKEHEEPTMEVEAQSKSESRDEETTEEGRSFSNTFSGTFSERTEGTGSFTEDGTYQTDSYGFSQDDRSAYSNDRTLSNDRSMSSEEPSRGSRCGASTMDYESIGEEEGVEMQISSLKKLNIENATDFLQRSQLSACATLTHLTKHCANARLLCNTEKVLENILLLAAIFEHPLHTRCLEMLCNFSRFPSNNAKLASMPKVIETLTVGGKSKLPEDRLWSIRTIQNLCSDSSSKVGLATGSLLSLLSACAMRKDYEEQLAAVGALMNLATEPGSIVPLTNTKTVVATLVHLAHSPNTPASVRKVACDSLATIGLWLQTLASAGTVPDSCPLSPLPTHTATGWLRWD